LFSRLVVRPLILIVKVMVAFGSRMRQRTVPEWEAAYVDYHKLKQALHDLDNFPWAAAAAATQSRPRNGYYAQDNEGSASDDADALSSPDEDAPFFHEDANICVRINLPREVGDTATINTEVAATNERQHRYATSDSDNQDETKDATQRWRLAATKITSSNRRTNAQARFFVLLDGEVNKCNAFFERRDLEQGERLDQLRAEAASACAELRQQKSQANEAPTRAALRRGSMRVSEMIHNGVYQKSHRGLGLTPEQRVRACLEHARELFAQVVMLKDFRELNAEAIRKIAKKYDKVTGSSTVCEMYCTNAEKLRFWPWSARGISKNDDVRRALDDMYVELNTALDEGDDDATHNLIVRKQLLAELHKGGRVIENRRYRASKVGGSVFGSGFVLGMSVPLWVFWMVGMLTRSDFAGNSHVSETLVMLRGLALPAFHALMYSGSVLIWERLRVNWSLIFYGSNSSSDDLLASQIAFCAGVLWTTITLVLLVVVAFPGVVSTDWLRPFLIVLLVSTLFPLPRWLEKYTWVIPPVQTRHFLCQHIVRLITAPLTLVTFPDFFVADQLTSQSTALADCAILFFATPDSRILRAAAGLLPSYIRVMQCLRRHNDWWSAIRRAQYKDDDSSGLQRWWRSSHLVNTGKYAFSIFAIIARLIAAETGYIPWPVAHCIVAAYACYALTWDLAMDWAIIRVDVSKCTVQVDERKRLITAKWRVAAAVADAILRATWVWAVVPAAHIDQLGAQGMVTVLAALEVARRSMWNIFRVENEHSSNCHETELILRGGPSSSAPREHFEPVQGGLTPRGSPPTARDSGSRRPSEEYANLNASSVEQGILHTEMFITALKTEV